MVVISDRGDLYLPECLANIYEVLPEVDVSVVDDQAHTLGMAGAASLGMEMALREGYDYVLWVEEDFRFNERPPVEKMIEILNIDYMCAQVVLKRQPWSVEEHEAGGIIEMNPGEYTDVYCNDLNWMSHTRIFSMNPCVIPRKVLEMGYPLGNEAEQTKRLVASGYHFAFYGKRDDPPLVTHVGHERGEGWKL